MNRLILENVTGVIIERQSHLNDTVSLIKKINKKICFGKLRVLVGSDTPNQVSHLDSEIEIISVPTMNIQGYNNFCVKKLHLYCPTLYCLLMQLDGFPIAIDNWDDCFYNYDYIGAPWLENKGHWWADCTQRYVGNGGFSFRSKRLLDASARLDYRKERGDWNEDAFISCIAGGELEKAGLKFADRATASKFSVEFSETDSDLKKCFGFHGKFNLGKINVRSALI